MRAIEIYSLNEGVSVHGAELKALAIAVAEAYDAAPVYDENAVASWKSLSQHNAEKLFGQIKDVDVQFSEIDPYSQSDPKLDVLFMLYDMIVNHRLMIYSGDSSHPVFSKDENLIFRTVHDYYTHGRLRKYFKQQIERLGLDKRKPTAEELKKILPNVSLRKSGIGHAFDLRGELNAYTTHAKLCPKSALPALFTEVVGQVCYQVITGHFGIQKVALLPGFDLIHVGKTIPGTAAEERVKQLTQEIDDRIDIQTSIEEKPIIHVEEVASIN